MTIERLHSEEGFPLDSKKPAEEQIKKIVGDNKASVETLSEGVYDLTPKWWTKHLMTHALKVLENGSAIYKATPREKGIGVINLDQGGFNQFKPGEHIAYMPRDTNTIMVGGPLKDKKTIGVYEIIIYTPGPNPK